jgi:hypothetical protein
MTGNSCFGSDAATGWCFTTAATILTLCISTGTGSNWSSSILSLANARCGKVKQSRLRPIPLAGFELMTYGRI